MYSETLCKQVENVAYKSCIDNYFDTYSKDNIKEYWIALLEKKRYCEARGVEKALELIDICQDLKNR